MASDTISSKLIEEVLPRDWYFLLNTFRSKFAAVDKEFIKLEKFSSMGNGFTFELESLIFFVFAQVACDECDVESHVSVFGDDVIIPVSTYDTYCSIVDSVGFTVNKDKSYFCSYYRESCGAHYWGGSCIKPIFLKEELYEEDSILKAANAVRRFAHRRCDSGCDRNLRRCWVFLASLLGSKVPRIGEGYGEAGLVVNYNELSIPPKLARHGLEGYLVRIWAFMPMFRFYDHRGLLLFKLKTLGCNRYNYRFNPLDITDAGSVGNEIPMPQQTKKIFTEILVPQWTDLGPWI
jgi:hypothetical protein